MFLPKCRGCGDPLTSERDSEAHIVPNALGGRLKSRGIICRECNGKLDEIADNPLINAFGAWPTLLDLPRDRGSSPWKVIVTAGGKKIRVEPDGSMSAVDVMYDIAPTTDGHQVQIAAGNMKTFRQLLKRAEKQFPQFDAQKAEKYARTMNLGDDDPLKLGFDFSPQSTFGGVITAIWLYLINSTGRAFMDWARLIDCVRAMRTSGGTFRYLVDGLPGLRGPDIPLNHKIVVRSVPATGDLIAYVEILGVLKVGGLFATGRPSTRLEHIYVHDILANVDRSSDFTVDPIEFEQQKWEVVGLGFADTLKLQNHFRSALETVFEPRYRSRFEATQ